MRNQCNEFAESIRSGCNGLYDKLKSGWKSEKRKSEEEREIRRNMKKENE